MLAFAMSNIDGLGMETWRASEAKEATHPDAHGVDGTLISDQT